jgi:autotransporter-associated beta strand protein
VIIRRIVAGIRTNINDISDFMVINQVTNTTTSSAWHIHGLGLALTNNGSRVARITATGSPITFTNAIRIDSPLTLNGNQNVTLNGPVSGTNFTSLFNGDTLTLGNTNNTFAGTITVAGGTLVGVSDSRFGNTNNVFDFTGTVNGSMGLNIGAGSLTNSRNITIGSGGTLTVTLTDDANIMGYVGGAGGLTHSDGNHLTLYCPTNDFQGNLASQTSAGIVTIYGLADTSANITVGGSSGGTSELEWLGVGRTFTNRILRFGGTVGGMIIDNSGAGPLTFLRDILIGVNGNKALNVQGSQNLILMGQITNNASSVISISKLGTADLYLGGSNNLTGNTTINAGTITLGNTNALMNSTINVGISQATNMLFCGTCNLTNVIVGGIRGTNNLILTNLIGNAVTFQVGNNNTTNTYAGKISGAGNFVKLGTGTLTLTNRHDYNGYTRIDGGTLQLNNTNEYPVATTLYIASGATNALNFTGSNYVSYLYLNGIAQPAGTYGTNDVTFTNTTYFASNGVLKVLYSVSSITDNIVVPYYKNQLGYQNELVR